MGTAPDDGAAASGSGIFAVLLSRRDFG